MKLSWGQSGYIEGMGPGEHDFPGNCAAVLDEPSTLSVMMSTMYNDQVH